MKNVSDAKLLTLYSKMLKRYLSVIDKSKASHEILRSMHDDVSRLNESQKLVEYMDQNTKLKKKLSLLIKASDPQAFRKVLLEKFIVKFVYHYVKENNFVFNKDKLVNLFCELDSYLEERALFHYSAPLFSFQQEVDNISISDIVIHKVTDEQKLLIQDYGMFKPIANGLPLIEQPISIMRTRNTKYDLEGKRKRFLQLAEILNLFTDQPVQLQYVDCKNPIMYPVETSAAVEVIGPRGHSPFVSTLTSENTRRLLKFCEKLPNLNISSKIRFAIKRYNYAKISRMPEDKIVDYVICLESLFGDPDSKTELKYKFSLRLALLHGRDSDDSKLLRQLFGLFYDARSHVVHGNDEQFRKIIRKIEKINIEWTNKLTTIAEDSIISFVNLMNYGINDIIQQIDDSATDDSKRQEIRTNAGLSGSDELNSKEK